MSIIQRYLLLSCVLLVACAGPLPREMYGRYPDEPPKVDIYYDGPERFTAETALLVTGQQPKQAYLFITRIDNHDSPNSSLVGGSLAASIMPGEREVRLQWYDRGRVSMPLTLDGITYKAQTAYLINYKVSYPDGWEDNPYGLNEKMLIELTVSNMDTEQVVATRAYDGWGQPVDK